MLLNKNKIFNFLICMIVLSNPILSQTAGEEFIPPKGSEWYNTIETINFPDIGLKELLHGIAIQNNLNCVVDAKVKDRVSLHLNNMTVWELYQYLAGEYHLQLMWTHGILKVMPEIAPLEKKITDRGTLNIIVEDSLISIVCKNVPVQEVVDSLIMLTGQNILIDPTYNDAINGQLKNVPVKAGIKTLFRHNQLRVKERDGIFFVTRSSLAGTPSEHRSGEQWVSFSDDGMLSLDIQGASISEVLQEITDQSSVPMISYTQIPGTITAKAADLNIDQGLSLVLKNTNATFRFDDGVYIIGDKTMQGMATRELVELKHIKSSGVEELLPRSLKSNLEIKEVKELNSLMLIGTRDLVSEAKSLINDIDKSTPQIMIEALVVDFQVSEMSEFELKFGKDPAISGSEIIQYFPMLKGSFNKANLEAQAQVALPGIISKNIGMLPADFYMQLKAMERDGIVKIRSKPHIATLNGHKASLVISTTQYYIFESEVIIPTTGQPTSQTTQRFEKVTAEIKLEIIPWVSADGEITVEIHPEFSTPVGTFDPNVPPTISSRIINSTVRLKDGETIILGGLIQTTENDTKTKFPFLGNLPIIGSLFRSRALNEGTSELVIYLTPHLNMPAVETPDIPTSSESK